MGNAYKGIFSKSYFTVFAFNYEGALESTTLTAVTTPRMQNLIGRMSKNKRDARAEYILEQFCAIICTTATLNYNIFGLDDNSSVQC